MNTSHELAEKPVGKLLLQYSIPATIAMIVNAIYNVVDRIFISQYAGEAAFAGLTVAFPLMLILFSFTNLVGIGGASLFSIALGRKESKKASHIFAVTLMLAVVFTAIIVLFGLLFAKPLLVLSGGTNEEILNYAFSYFKIILYGYGFQMFSFSLSSFVRTENHPRLTMLAMLVSAGSNIILDFVFISIFQMGVEGAAYATIIGQASGLFILLSFYFRKKSVVKLTKSSFALDVPLIGKIITIGFSAFVSVLGASFSALILNNVLAQNGGDKAIAAMGAINSLFTFFIMPTDGITQALQPIIGYNFGASQYDRVFKTLKLGLISNILFASLIFVLYECFPAFFMGLFLQKGSDTMEVAIPALRLFMLSIPLLAINIISVGYFQAIAKGTIAFVLGLLRPFVFLIPFAFILPSHYGLTGAWLAQPITDILAVICSAIALFISYTQLKRQAQEKREELA
ncbi:MATE family efflux transporter [Fervidibacillus albus]|uniref:Multidrug export protein MepA n=1 Tax=Fervidibacillus albus TaxID=2980026 RepID=A0A9E8LTY5_9BACI|nr:MATE family efflux transporter [Fervidibacillus albus]WAA09131.1 MATE family efflux transporter [Fervidibacillus albus]